MSAKQIGAWTGAILGLAGVVALVFTVDSRYYHAEAAGQAFYQQAQKIVFKDTQRQLEIIELKIRLLLDKMILTPSEQAELDSLRLQQAVLIEQLKELERQ